MGQIRTDEILSQLTEILDSKDFQASPRLKDFLTYVVQQTLAAKGQELKAYAIALDVFGQGKDFDPNANPRVRTEAGRLRSKLEHFYLHNPFARIKISIPKGGYAASFARIQTPEGLGSIYESKGQVYSFNPSKVAQPEHKACILLLPFSNVNKTEEVNSFMEGLISTISIHLTKFRELKVIDYHQLVNVASAFEQIKAKNLNVEMRFVLCGSVQLDKNIFEVRTSLVDTFSMHNIWAEKFDAELDSGSLLELQENIAESIVYRIADDFGLLHRTLLHELASGTSSSSSIQQAALLYHHWTTVLTKNDFLEALRSVEKAHQSNPTHAPTMAMLADLYASNHQWSYGLIENSLEKSLQIATRAVNQDPGCQMAYVALALNYHLRSDRDKFKFNAERAIALNPSSTNAISAIGSWYAMSGMWDEAFALIEKIMNLTPTCPGWCHFALAMHKYIQGDYDASLQEAKKINMPESLWDPLIRLAAGGYLGEQEDCDQALATLLNIHPDFREKGYQIVSNNLPNKLFFKQILLGLKQAGLNLKACSKN